MITEVPAWAQKLLSTAAVWPEPLQDIARAMTLSDSAAGELIDLADALVRTGHVVGLGRETGRALFDIPFGYSDLWTALHLRPLDQEADRLDRVLPTVRQAHPCAVHGTPITPVARLRELAGASFCVSYYSPEQLKACIELLGPDSLLLLDNGAFSAWKGG